jgi:hypothetical protein
MVARLHHVSTYRTVFGIREFRALFSAEAASVAGKTMETLALSTLVYLATGSPLLAALAFLGGFLPRALGALTLLSLADRVRPRAFLAGWDLARAAVAATLALRVLPVWGMLILIMMFGVGDAVAAAVRGGLLIDVLPEGAYVLGRSVLNISVGGMQIVGYAVGGTLLAVAGTSGALWSAAGLALATAAIDRFLLRERGPRTTGRAGAATTWRGNRVLLGRAQTRGLLLAQWLPNGLIVGAEALYVPYAGRAAGALFVAAALGMLLGDITIGRFTGPQLRASLALPLYGLLALPYVAFAWRPGVVAAVALVAVASFGHAASLVAQERYVGVLPESLVGQGMGLASSGMMTAQALAAAAVGALAEMIEPGPAMAVAGIASLTATLTLLRHVGSRWDPADRQEAPAQAPVPS